MEAIYPIAVEWFKEANIAHCWCFKLTYLFKQLYKMVGSEYEHISRKNVMFFCVGCGGYLVCSECKLLCLHDQHVYLIHILLYKCRNWITTCQHSLGFSKVTTQLLH